MAKQPKTNPTTDENSSAYNFLEELYLDLSRTSNVSQSSITANPTSSNATNTEDTSSSTDDISSLGLNTEDRALLHSIVSLSNSFLSKDMLQPHGAAAQLQILRGMPKEKLKLLQEAEPKIVNYLLSLTEPIPNETIQKISEELTKYSLLLKNATKRANNPPLRKTEEDSTAYLMESLNKINPSSSTADIEQRTLLTGWVNTVQDSLTKIAEIQEKLQNELILKAHCEPTKEIKKQHLNLLAQIQQENTTILQTAETLLKWQKDAKSLPADSKLPAAISRLQSTTKQANLNNSLPLLQSLQDIQSTLDKIQETNTRLSMAIAQPNVISPTVQAEKIKLSRQKRPSTRLSGLAVSLSQETQSTKKRRVP